MTTHMLQHNNILFTDAYKETHWKQLPEGTTKIYSYLEARQSDIFGLQIILKKYLSTPFTKQDIDDAETFCQKVFGTNHFNRAGFEYILEKYNGYWPVRIKAVPEGTVVNLHNVLMTIENTDDNVPFVTDFLETMLMQVWYPITVATVSFKIKTIIAEYCNLTGCEVSPFHLNDFGFRGVSSRESAGIGGAANLINFDGTDTLEGIIYAQQFYNANHCGFSVPATQHGTTIVYGQAHECEAYSRFLDLYPTGIVSIVSDSYDIYNAVDMFGTILKDKVLARDGKLVIRPDSGDPVEVTVEVLKRLDKYFGSTINEKGYKVLNPKVGIIYGDGIDDTTIYYILDRMERYGFAASNVVFGMGGALLQKVNRDTFGFAIKCSETIVNGEVRKVSKKSNSEFKRSKAGRLKLVRDGKKYKTVNEDAAGEDILRTVYENGVITVEEQFDVIKARTNEFINP